MKHKLILSYLSILVIFLFLASPVEAEIVTFNIADKGDYDFSLNENLSVSTSGKIGPGCTFSVKLSARGEWTAVGDYYDTPPYGWGHDIFLLSEGLGLGSLSFTCSKPTYLFDPSSMPSYVTKIGECDQVHAKTFQLHMIDSAPTSGSFNLAFSFTASCELKRKDGTPCTPKKEINPRGDSTTLAFDIQSECLSTPTPRPTKTPSPTPSMPSSPQPTPTQSTSVCDCYLLTTDQTNLTAVKRGTTLNFTGEAYVSPTQTAQVTNMGFNLTHKDTGKVIANSGLIECDGIIGQNGSWCDFDRNQKINNISADVYRAQWSYQIKDTDPLGDYHLQFDYNCDSSTQAYNAFGKTSFSVAAPPTTQKPKLSFWQRLLSILGLITQPEEVKTQSQVTPSPLPTPTRPKGKSIKIGTFPSLPQGPNCTELYFRVVE